MEVRHGGLRERMRSLTVEELRAVIRGRGGESTPDEVRVLFYLASAAAVLEIIVLAFFLALFLTARGGSVHALAVSLRFGIAGLWCFSLARAVRSQHRDGRRSVLSLLSLALVITLTVGLVTGDFTDWRGGVLCVLTLAFCYVAFSRAVDRYYNAPGAVAPA